ncbi:MAG: imelysin family protein [Pseudomonadota bacterium]
MTAAPPGAVLHSIGTNTAAPRIARTLEAAQSLHSKTSALCESPGVEQLESSRTAWRELYLSWSHQQAVMFGPGREQGLRRHLFSWPTHAMIINAVLEPGVAEDVALNRHVRGLPAVEFMLFGDQKMPVEAGMFEHAGRCAHLDDIMSEVVKRIGAHADVWTNGFGDGFVAKNSPDSEVSRLSMLLAEALNTVDDILWQRLGGPAGLYGGIVQTEDLDAWRSGETLAGLEASLVTINDIVSGAGPEQPGIANLLANRNSDAASDLVRSTRDAVAIAREIEGPLAGAILDRPGTVKDLYAAVQDVQNYLIVTSEQLELAVEFEKDGD